MEAAEAFTEALQLCIPQTSSSSTEAITPTKMSSSSLLRQQITLLNNRSAMYEKAGVLELALDDCDQLLELELTHTKARARRLRLLEAMQKYDQALQEFCAINLLFMQANRVNLRMGLPVPPPPVPQQKMEELLNQILPQETEKYLARLFGNNDDNNNHDADGKQKTRTLPGSYTILQLLKSYTNYNGWMAQAAQNGTVATLTQQLDAATTATSTMADRATLLLRRGIRYVYDRKYEEASGDFEEAYAILQNHPDVVAMLEGDTQARILEWTGMVRHWHYQLDSALEILGKAADLEPDNALLLVKQAGIQLDAGRQDECLKLFDMALAIDPNNVDALLHRSNLRLMQGQPDTAKVDLEKCLKLRPNHTMARLRLASILFPMEKLAEAKRQLELAESSEPNSSEVHSYRGELHFAQGEMDDAVREFETAISLEPSNPTPYVNAALAVLNTPPKIAGQPPDVEKATSLFEQAIRVDPQFAPAYIHLGQFQLASATNLASARKVIEMYDRALENCRSPEEIKELVGMRIMGVAQVEAAQALKMETFNMQ
jgi:import receptor subunit TOM70